MKTEQRLSQHKKSEKSSPPTQSSRDCLLVLVILLSLFVIFSGVLSYSIFQSLNMANQRLQKMELKFHKFLFYIRYIYKSEKSQQQISKQQNNSIINFLNKISQGFEQKKQRIQMIQEQSSLKERSRNAVVIQKKQLTSRVNYKQRYDDEVELLSEKEMIDIAIKIIEQEDHSLVNKPQSKVQSINQKDVKKQEKLPIIIEEQVKLAEESQTQTFPCNIDEENAFYKHFQFNPSTLRLMKSKSNSRFQSIFCQQVIPNSGIYQFPIKILRTSKSFIYIGIASGNKTQTYNITSLHETDKFYGYSGYSGRIWEATKRKNSYEMVQSNTILKLKVNMDSNLMEYFFNQIKVGQSQLGNFCQNQCRFVILMRDDGDQIQFLQTLKVHTAFNTTKLSANHQL